MSETRIVEIVYGLGGFDPTKPNSNVVETETKVFSDAELAEEADQKDLLAKIDLISTLTHAQLAVVVERMAKRLVNKGLLP